MRLLNTSSLLLHTFTSAEKPKYAILSHTWDEDEFLFEDIHNYQVLDKALPLHSSKYMPYAPLRSLLLGPRNLRSCARKDLRRLSVAVTRPL